MKHSFGRRLTKDRRKDRKDSYGHRLARDFKKNKSIYFLAIPLVLFYILFHYKTMYGAIIAFYQYRPARGIAGSKWVGLKNFIYYFESPFFWRTIKNTLTISLLSLAFAFPAPIILALLLNEVGNKLFKKSVQTITYLPHFISLVVVCGMLNQFCLSTGLFSDVIAFFGGERVSLLQGPDYYRTVYIASDIWKEVGWGSILYLAALSGVDKQLYEAASIDGANKWQQTWRVTLPGILPTIVIQLILKIGSLMSVGYDKTLLLYNPTTYNVADIISTYTYRMGLELGDWSYSTAIGLLNSVINCILLVIANKLSKKLTESSLW